jgi:hypothetical protein
VWKERGVTQQCSAVQCRIYDDRMMAGTDGCRSVGTKFGEASWKEAGGWWLVIDELLAFGVEV